MKWLDKLKKIFNELRLDDEHRGASRVSRRAEIIKGMQDRTSAEELRKEIVANQYNEESV